MSKRLAVFSDSQLIDFFLDSKIAQGCTKDTQTYYRYNLTLFRAYLHTQEVPLLEADQFHITAFLAIRAKEVSPRTLHIYFRVLKTFYNWCIENSIRSDNPVKKVLEPKIPHKVITPLDEEHLERMFDTCGYSEYLKARNYALLLVMLDTGVRRSEVVAMKLQDVNWKNRTIKIHGKGKKERIVPFGVRTSLALKKYLLYHPRICDNVWLTEELTPLHSRGLQSFFRRLKYRAGISDRRCSAHDMRHTFACMILNNGASMKTTQDLLGHADQTSTEIYTEPAQLLKMMREYEQASPVERLNMYKQRWK